LALGRSIDLWVAVWAVAKSGAAFVPLDPGTPPDRMTYLLGDSHASVGMTVSEHRTTLPNGVPWIFLDDNDFAHTLRRRSAAPVGQNGRIAPLRVDNPAYMIYTSGSTGTPKGVVVTHRGLGNFAAEQRDRYTLTADSRVLQVAMPSFDAMMLELLMVAASGGLLIVSPPGVFAGDELSALVTDRNVTHAFLTPGVLSTLSPHRLGSLKVLVAGGEAVPADVVDRWAPGRRLYNGYGPTETAIMAAISTPLSSGSRVTIGGPIRGMDAVVLDTRLHPVPIGVEGELYLSGIQLARGYHNRTPLTAARFIANPYGTTGQRLYRTGDLARWTPTGELEFLGRTDFQIKIRGLRIELGEIETVLATHPTIHTAIATSITGPSGNPHIAAYLTPTTTEPIDTATITAHAARHLPNYMVPTTITILDELPLTPNGKIDRNALPQPTLHPTTEHHPPHTPTEHTITEIFTHTLGINHL
ncbi:amino acid adenylation domain-containing protein, partial [Rhodococcus jostii]